MARKTNKLYWDKRKVKYPHHVEVKPSHTPTVAELNMIEQTCGNFLRVPLGEVTMWGFLTRSDADKFRLMYNEYAAS